MLTLLDVYKSLSAQPLPSAGWQSRAVREVVIDSRQATPGSLFVALPGEKTDGHRYVSDALQRGAVAALIEKDVVTDAECWMLDTRAPVIQHSAFHSGTPVLFRVDNTLRALQDLAGYWRVTVENAASLRVIGITGSVGKTSTKEVVAAVLSQRYPTLKTGGNLNNEIGLPLTLLQLTPAHRRAVLEMGMYDVGDIATLCRLARPVIGIVTNVGPVHLSRAKTMERIAQAKTELVEALPPDGVAVLNVDDPIVAAMAQKSQARVFTYGLDSAADLWADDVTSEGHEGIRFRLQYGGEELFVKVPLLGRHSVHTALRATAVGLIEGLSWEEIVGGLQDVQGQLRLLVVPGLRGITVLDDTYSASPAATLAALNLLADLPVQTGGRRVAVLGDMLELGSYAEMGHRKTGRRAVDVADKLIAVGPLSAWTAQEALDAGMPATHVFAAQTNDDALNVLRTLVREGDLVLVKGSRALHMEDIVSALSRPAAEDD